MPQNDDTLVSEAIALSLFAAGLPGVAERNTRFANLRDALARIATQNPKSAAEIQFLVDAFRPSPQSLAALRDFIDRIGAQADGTLIDMAHHLLNAAPAAGPAATGATAIEIENRADTSGVSSEVNVIKGGTVDQRKSITGKVFNMNVGGEKVQVNNGDTITNNFTF
ncbi:hypothetical protein [Azospirillum rugosum]|uniref:Uncharacterized protein n=1 Tax=Azospirillum rugosum TaxID=416170 RepID=A0ABS4SRQ8_9PROT|nr:hypothetical protein [Azospirillum rugosum]MBP2295251.1 hypothetical protein [Azospirillum rugosum]MDQ0528625.1 hypothetical protein [Azospirillum rugosum]